jgi:Kef-type K+ transport system membrane component KefB
MFEFWSFFLILFAALTFSTLFSRLHLPWVLALIVGGMIVGPHGAGWLVIDPTIEFFAQIGLVFLMFMAGLETPVSKIRHRIGSISILSFINGVVPLLVGIALTRYFGYSWETSLLVGIVFISSSVAIIIPSLEANALMETKIGQSILASTVMQDISSLLLLSLLLQNIRPETSIPLPLFYLIIILLIVTGRTMIVKIRSFIHGLHKGQPDVFETELRVVFVLLLGTVALFELLGLHAIIGGFMAGLMLSEAITSRQLRSKLHAISFGIFIPIFFVIVGAQTDIAIIFSSKGALLLASAIVLGSFFSKLISGWVGAHFLGYSEIQSRLFAISSTPQLSTTLAVVFTGYNFGILDQKLVNAMILLSLFTTFIGPIVTGRLMGGHRKELLEPNSYLT